MKHLFLLFLAIALFSCQKERKLPPPAETVVALRQMEELATVEYTVSKVVKANDNQTWYKWGDRKILITCEANIKAGIDLKDLTTDDVNVEGKSISLQLPLPKLLSVNLPPEGVKVAYEELSIFRQPFTSADRDNLLYQAEMQIRSSGRELGILDQAKGNTELFLTKFLTQLGFEKVTINYKEDPKPTLPFFN